MKKTNKGPILIIIGVLLILGSLNMTSTENGSSRESIIFDNMTSTFDLSNIVVSSPIYVNDLVDIEVTVQNKEDVNGQMYVQCSILNLEDYTFLNTVSRESVVTLPTGYNCVQGEPFTQTAVVNLKQNEKEKVAFVVTVPDTVGKTNFAYCAAYEQCDSESTPSYESDSLMQAVIVKPESENLKKTVTKECIYDDDCVKKWYNWLSGDELVCENNQCVRDEPEKKVSNGTNDTIKQWFVKNKYLALIIGASLVIIGWLFSFDVFKKKEVWE